MSNILIPVTPPSADSPPTTTSPTQTATSTSTSTASKPHTARTQRSCTSCRARKIKCDKSHPCSACKKSSLQCIFPEQGRRPPRPRQPDPVLMGRLSRLEGVLEKLAKTQGGAQVQEMLESQAMVESDKGRRKTNGDDSFDGRFSCPEVQGDQEVAGMERQMGRLVVSDGKSRYISQNYWALNEEVEDLKEILSTSSAAEEPPSFSNYPSFFFRTASEDINWYHPVPGDARELYYNQFILSVDPIIRILHKPSFERDFELWLCDKEQTNIRPGFEALLFSVYFAAVVSMHPNAVLSRYSATKPDLVAHYRCALEQALANAKFTQSEELETLIAFTIFISSNLRQDGTEQSSWALTGLAIRIGQSLGLHRDGAQFGVPPIEREVRRRLWHELCLLDLRTAEERGIHIMVTNCSYDTKVPLNINDVDLTDAVEPVESTEYTEMVFSIQRFYAMRAFRNILGSPIGGNTAAQLEEKDRRLQECMQEVREKYLQNLDLNVPIQACSDTLAALMEQKGRLFLWHPYRQYRNGSSLGPGIKEKLFESALKSLEAGLFMATDPLGRASRWNWFFQSFHQEHGVALVLLELCQRPPSPLTDHAWETIDRFLESRDLFRTGVDNTVEKYIRPLHKLRERAMQNRRKWEKEEKKRMRSDTSSTGRSEDGSSSSGMEVSPINWGEWDELFKYDTTMMAVDGMDDVKLGEEWSPGELGQELGSLGPTVM